MSAPAALIPATASTPPRADRGPAATAAPAPSVVVVRDAAGLGPHVAAWEALAESAIEPNVFYEPWMLLPALRFAGGADLQVVLVYLPDPARPQGPPLLCGFFPLERRPRCKGLPTAVLGLWRHLHCFLCTPLLRAGHAREALAAFFDWAAGRRGAPLVEFGFVTADGPFHYLLLEELNRHGRLTFVDECFPRALLRPAGTAEAYLAAALSTGNRKELRRQRRRLAQAGTLDAVALGPEDDPTVWIDNFLDLEARGWKGDERTALAASAEERAYFRTIAVEAFRRGRLMMLALHLDGRPIALKCNFLAGEGAFAFKIAYDEDFARYSPGVQLELDNIEAAHACRSLRWMDSCAAPGHPMIDRLWKDRRVIQTMLVSTGRMRGDLVVSLLPLLRWLKRIWRPRAAGLSS